MANFLGYFHDQATPLQLFLFRCYGHGRTALKTSTTKHAHFIIQATK